MTNNDVTESPTQVDVLLGRGVATTRHPGNKRFRSIVSEHITVYATSTKKQKMTISRSIVEKIKADGRFLEKEAGTGLWHEVDDRRALEKTAQALRDGAAPIRKRLLEDVTDPSFLDALFHDEGSPNSPPSPSQKQGKKKHRRTKSANCATPSHAKKLRAGTDIVRSSSVPVQAERMHVTQIQSRVASQKRQEHTLQPLVTTSGNGTHDEFVPQNVLSLGLYDEYAPLPLALAHGEAEVAIPMDDILEALEILSDTGIPFLKMDVVEDGWQHVLGEWQER
mmetsp:Transcript_1240/g.2684  ORF Transcript_1240/g.2684 Transcript_1240/m.2684 type:complete len:280 (+) Transcript_1240:331-1170(+)